MSGDLMTELQIPIPSAKGQRFDCPLCESKLTLSVEPDPTLGWWWACTGCFQTGNAEDGWTDDAGLDKGFLTFKDLEDELADVYKNGLARGLPLEWPITQDLYTVRRGEWTLVTGMPSHGKSEFMDSLVMSLAIDHDWRIAVFSPENMPHKLHATKLIEKLAGLPALPNRPDRMDISTFALAREVLNERFFFVYPKKRTIEDILAIVELLVRKHRVSGVIIDPWNEIEHQRPASLNETEYISQTLSRIRGFARAKDIHIWLIAHPTKMMRDKNGNYPVPRPYDVSGSAHFYNKADNCLTIWRDAGAEDEETRNTVELHVQKVRFKMTGKVGLCQLFYERASGCFRDLTSSGNNPSALTRWKSKRGGK